MQEVISFAIMTETPLVIVDVQRPGPGQGYITTGQEDVMQARWGHHGEGSIIALSPASVQDMFDFTVEAFNLAERWRTPVLLMAEETVAHMRERLIVPPLGTIPIVNRTKPQDMGIAPEDYLPYGHGQVPPMATWGDGYQVNHVSLVHHADGNVTRYNPKVHFENVARIHRKIEDNVDDDRPARDARGWRGAATCSSATVRCRAPGSRRCWRPARSAGIPLGSFDFKTLWPFPGAAAARASARRRRRSSFRR